MKKEEYSSIAKNLQNISDGTLSIERTQTGENIGKTFFTEQFQAMTIGKGRMEVHNVYLGIEASFNTFLAPEIHFQHSALDSVLEIHYCRNGRMGWNMRGGTAIYLGSGDLTAHSMACCSNSTMMFPLGYSEGVSLSVDLEKLSTVCPEILQSAGVASNLLWEKFCSGKPSAIPACSDLEHIFAPLFSAPAPMRLPLLKLKVLEVLIYLGNMKSGRKELTQYFSQQTELIKEIRQQLTEHLEQRFTIEELSKQYLINTSTLKEVFKAVYRVSTKGQVEKDDIPMQKEACRNFAESQGWEIVKEFSEKGVSGFKKSAKDRDELQKIQQAAMEGKFDILLVFMFDRLGRRDDETPFIVEWFTKQGIEVWSVNEGQQRFDTHVDKLMNYIRYWQASGESLKTSVRTRTRLEQLTEEGHYTGGTVPFGYKRVRLGRVNKKNQEVCDLVVDEAEAEIVRLIFHKYVYEGYGAQKLSHYLYEQGVVGRNNKNIPNTSIVRMIKNKGYTGYLINGAVETECPQLRIIEPELFEQAQELRQARTCERGGTSLGTSSKALLTGLVYCAHCGNRLSLTSSGRTHTYADGHTVKEVRPRYSCFYKIRHPGDCDGQSGYGVSKLDSIVEEVVRQIFAQFREVSRKKLLESVKTNDAARIQKKIKKIQKDLEAKQKELDDLKAETILVIRGVSALDKELLGTLVAEAKDALETLEKQLVQAQEEYEEATKTAKRSNYICNELFTWADVYDTANHDERRAILQQFIKEIRVRKDYEISITLNASFNQVEQLKAVSTYDGAEIFEGISEKGA